MEIYISFLQYDYTYKNANCPDGARGIDCLRARIILVKSGKHIDDRIVHLLLGMINTPRA